MENEVRDATVALAHLLARGETRKAAACYAEDGRLLTPSAELITGRPDIEAYWRTGVECGLAHVELRAIDVQVNDVTAVEIGRYVLIVDADGRPGVADRGKYLVLHRRQSDGVWRRAVDVYNPDVPERASRRTEEEQ